MAKKATAKKASAKKASRAKKNAAKAKASAKRGKTALKKKARKPATPKASARKRPARKPEASIGTQSVETVQLKGRRRSAAAGAGGGDFGGVSIVEDVDSESAEELLEEGQAFEAGIVSGVENAPDPDQGEVRTHEVSQDDVPEEYDDKDRP